MISSKMHICFRRKRKNFQRMILSKLCCTGLSSGLRRESCTRKNLQFTLTTLPSISPLSLTVTRSISAYFSLWSYWRCGPLLAEKQMRRKHEEERMFSLSWSRRLQQIQSSGDLHAAAFSQRLIHFFIE